MKLRLSKQQKKYVCDLSPCQSTHFQLQRWIFHHVKKS